MQNSFKQIILLALVTMGVSSLSAAIEFKVAMDHTNCIYRCNEPATFTVSVLKDGAPLTTGEANITLDNFGKRKQLEKKIDLKAENPFVVKGQLATPGFLRLSIKIKDRKDPYVWSVGYEPEKITPGVAKPSDFEEFWKNAIADLDAKVPVDAKMDKLNYMSLGSRDVYYVSFATYGGRRVYGLLAEPKDLSKGPFPVKITVPGAGPVDGFVPGGADTIGLVMNVHFYPTVPGCGRRGAGSEAVHALHVAQEREWKAKYGISGYQLCGIAKSREDYFYYAAILGINRAVNWLAARKECDRQRIRYTGTSQGGGFGLILSALNPNITRAAIFVPAMTDLMSFKTDDRQSGWPLLIEKQLPAERAEAERWAPYFDGAHFASMIHIPVRVVVGFADTTCAPHAVYAGYNAIPSADKAILHGFGMGHGPFSTFFKALDSWLMR